MFRKFTATPTKEGETTLVHVVTPDEKTTSDMKEQVTNDTGSTSTQQQQSQHKPLAGSTTMKIDHSTEFPVGHQGHVFAGWRDHDASDFSVRSRHYTCNKHKEKKLKLPSPGSLYECASVDIFESTTRIPNMASRVELPQVPEHSGKTWAAPDVFCVSIFIPTGGVTNTDKSKEI